MTRRRVLGGGDIPILYIENTSGLYIDTEYTIKSTNSVTNTQIVFDLDFPLTSSNRSSYESYLGSDYTFIQFRPGSSGNSKYGYWKASICNRTSRNLSYNYDNFVNPITICESITITAGNVSMTTATPAFSRTNKGGSFSNTATTTYNDLNLLLFTSLGYIDYTNSPYRIYSFEIKENGTTVKKFVPVIHDGVACMYEEISGTYFYDQNGNGFIAGPRA